MSIRVYIDMPNAIGDNIKELYAVVEMKDGTRSVSGGNIMVWAKEPTAEDCISRQAVNEGFKKYDSGSFAYGCVWDYINKLPSVTPKEKTGKWIKIQSGDGMFPMSIVCSKCNNENSHLDFNEHAEPIGKVYIKSRYCPNCGARMVSE